jgi:hypothetical protein
MILHNLNAAQRKKKSVIYLFSCCTLLTFSFLSTGVLFANLQRRSRTLLPNLLSPQTTDLNVFASEIGVWTNLFDFFKDHPVLRDIVLHAYGAKQMIISDVKTDPLDIVFVGHERGPNVNFSASIPSNNAITMWIQCENFELTDFAHQFVHNVDVSLGSSASVSSPNYQHTPCWIICALSRDAEYPLQLPPGLIESIEPEVWRSRERFAIQISNHGAFPRSLLVEMLGQFGRVEQFGKWGNKSSTLTDWPLHLKPRWSSNAYFFKRFRYAICPESHRSPSGGYTTEKIVMAHLSGAIPVYWGDLPTIQVFNPSRILFLDAAGLDDPKLPKALDGILATILQLERNASFRREWFSRPLLNPGASEWVESWVENVTGLINRARTLKWKR